MWQFVQFSTTGACSQRNGPRFSAWQVKQVSLVELAISILGLAERAGISGGKVFQVNKSVDTKTVNAYVTGVGATKRIVLWDTILAKLEPDQVEFVVAHELGHFVLHHVLAWILVVTILAILSLSVVHRVASGVIARFSRGFGFDRLSDIASLPLLILLGTAVSFVATPLLLGFSRYQEHEADRFAIELTRNNRAAATTLCLTDSILPSMSAAAAGTSSAR